MIGMMTFDWILMIFMRFTFRDSLPVPPVCKNFFQPFPDILWNMWKLE